ncbi:MAG: lipid-A-disaccharide synthase [Thermodesulfobacteria bacterium]|nr:lipid-A-disaccharide synthase [Thermodesulfobacteriota bacterium]
MKGFSCRILLITGEISGDTYGALLIKTFRELNTGFHFITIGGPKIRSLGVEVLFPAENLALVGIPSFSELKRYYFVYKKIKELLKKKKVDAVILVDFPGFNLKIAKLAKKLGYPVIYFVAPQVWAWHRRRINIIKKYIDRLYVILPFEKEFFASHGIDTVFLGHPLLDLVKPVLSKSLLYQVYNISENLPLISFFPGSREKEVARHIPLFLKVVSALKSQGVKFEAIMVKAPGLSGSILWEEAGKQLKVVENTQYEVLKASDVAVLASGTITLEAGILETPAVVTYSLPKWMFFIAKRLVKVPFVSLTNLILNKPVYPEIVGEGSTEGLIVKEVKELLFFDKKREEVKQELKRLKRMLGTPGASWRIAEDMIKYLMKTLSFT